MKIPMVGKRYGSLVVLAEAGLRHYESSHPRRLVRVACDCGRQYVADAALLRQGSTRRCSDCRDRISATRGRSMSTRLPSGETFVSVAEKSGVSLNTVTQRWLRGWPEADLGLPVKGKRPRAVPRFRPGFAP